MARQQNSMLAAIGGFVLGPAIVGIAAGLATKSSQTAASPQTLSYTFAAAHAAGLVGAWWAADKYPQFHSLLRGAMWGEGVSTVFAAADASALLKPPVAAAAPATPGTTTATLALAKPSTQSVEDLTRKVLKGGWFA